MSSFLIAGVTKEQRDSTVNSLNQEYHQRRAGGETQVLTLLSLTNKFPYRLNSDKSVRIIFQNNIGYLKFLFIVVFLFGKLFSFVTVCTVANITAKFSFQTLFQVEDVNEDSDDYSICVFQEHREFVKVCREAEAKAQLTGQKALYWWRGYRGVVAANLPPITLPGLKVRLMNALEKIPLKSKPETMVIF